jgi:hypothetical protein
MTARRPYRHLGFFFLGLLALVLAGFTPRIPDTPFFGYLGRAPDFAGVPAAVHFHALVCVAWFALLIVQPFLIEAGRPRVHRWLGWASIALVVLFAGSVDWLQWRRFSPGLLFDPAFFVAFYALALLYRRRFFRHVAFVVAAALMAAQPGLARLGIHLAGGFAGVIYTMIALYLAIIVFWLHARFAYGRPLLRSPFLVVLAMFMLDHALTFAVG